MIDAARYFDRCATLISQYELAVRAVDGFHGDEAAIQSLLDEELDDLRDVIANSFNWQSELYDHWVFSEQGAESFLKKAKVGVCERLGEVHLRIRQNHVVLMVTFLNACLEDIHRAILREEPTLLRWDRKIPLSRVLSSSTEKILEEEIEREIVRIAQQPVSARASYFAETLNLSWYGDPIVHMFEEASNLRDDILHENPDAKVTELDLSNARMVSIAVPLACISQASIPYPNVFTPLGEFNEEIRALLVSEGRLFGR